nr:hypothetical protein HUO10_006078 [Paraburkholderia busanensis]
MKTKIRSAEFLVAVAIISSATVMQIREHLRQPDGQAASEEHAATSCGAMHEGLMPASCEATRDERNTRDAGATRHARDQRQVDRAPQPRVTPRIWV